MTGETARQVERSADQTKTAAQATASAAQTTKTSAERTVELAADRTVFAAERTYAAWVRTGLVALASGIGAQKLLQGVVPPPMALGFATVLLLFSAFCFGAGVWRQLLIGTDPPEPNVRQLSPAVLAVLNGFLALVALTALVGVWLGPRGG